MENNIDKTIIKVFQAVFNVKKDDIKTNTSPDNLEDWDSIKHLNLLLALEDEFDLIISDSEASEMLNFELISHIIHEKLDSL